MVASNAAQNNSQSQRPGFKGAVVDFGRSCLPGRISRLAATLCAGELITSAILHSTYIAEFACTVWAEAHATIDSP
jgi:hypothetical protein